MRKCEYCKREDNAKWLVEHEWPFGQNVKLRFTELITSRGLEIICDMGAEELFNTLEKINFCPMCGRKLSERNNE